MDVKEKVRSLVISTLEEHGNVAALKPFISDTSSLILEETDKLNLGLVNYLYRVKAQDGSTMVAKYCPPYIKSFGDAMPLTQKRMELELFALKEFNRLSPNSVPTIYCYSIEKHILLMEELTDYDQLWFEWKRGNISSKVIETLAKHLANIHSATHVLNLSEEEFQAVKDSVKEHEPMILDMLGAFTEYIYITSPTDDLQRRLGERGKQILADPASDAIMKEFIANYTGDKNCFIHGDTRPQDIMSNDTDAKLIDPEFAHTGPDYMDICLTLTRIISMYFYHLTHEEDNEGHRKIAYQLAELGKLFVNTYFVNVQWNIVNKIEYVKNLMKKLSRVCGGELIRSVLTHENEGLGESLFESLEAGYRLISYCKNKDIDNIDRLMFIALGLE